MSRPDTFPRQQVAFGSGKDPNKVICDWSILKRVLSLAIPFLQNQGQLFSQESISRLGERQKIPSESELVPTYGISLALVKQLPLEFAN